MYSVKRSTGLMKLVLINVEEVKINQSYIFMNRFRLLETIRYDQNRSFHCKETSRRERDLHTVVFLQFSKDITVLHDQIRVG